MRGRSMRMACRGIAVCGVVSAVIGPLAAAPVLSDLKGDWVLLAEREGHLGLAIDVVGQEVMLREMIRVGYAECMLTGSGSQIGATASAKVNSFVVHCSGKRMFGHPRDCTFKAGQFADIAEVSCSRGKQVGPTVMLRRVRKS